MKKMLVKMISNRFVYYEIANFAKTLYAHDDLSYTASGTGAIFLTSASYADRTLSSSFLR